MIWSSIPIIPTRALARLYPRLTTTGGRRSVFTRFTSRVNHHRQSIRQPVAAFTPAGQSHAYLEFCRDKQPRLEAHGLAGQLAACHFPGRTSQASSSQERPSVMT